MHLVVFACPVHYHIVQLAVQQAKKHLPKVQDVTIVWDDVYLANKLASLNLGKRLSQTLDCKVVCHTDLDCCQREPNGWLRQQYVKLHLHRYFPDAEWFVLDGDVVFRNNHQVRDSQGRPVFESYFWDRDDHAVAFNEQALKIHAVEPGSAWMTPHWLAERTVLEAVHAWFDQQWNQSFLEYFHQYKKVNNTQNIWMFAPLNEVELYGVFADRYLNHAMTHVNSKLKCCLGSEFVDLWHTTDWDLCLGGRDNFSSEFWSQQGIEYQWDLDQELNA